MKTMTTRTFYKTVVSFEVLSEDPIPSGMTIEQIAHEAAHGDYSMGNVRCNETELNEKEAAESLLDHGSDPMFFGIDY